MPSNDQNGILIRHAGSRPAFTVFLLPVPMIEPAFGTLLVAPNGAAPLQASGLLATGRAAIALSAITLRTQRKQDAAFAAQANPWPENYLVLSRHAYAQAGLDTLWLHGTLEPVWDVVA